jgi:hypothetical protein
VQMLVKYHHANEFVAAASVVVVDTDELEVASTVVAEVVDDVSLAVVVVDVTLAVAACQERQHEAAA